MLEARELGRRLGAAREAKALGQQAASDALVGLPRTAATELEAGRRSVSTLELTRLAEFYSTSVPPGTSYTKARVRRMRTCWSPCIAR